jgi:hypothetical protein
MDALSSNDAEVVVVNPDDDNDRDQLLDAAATSFKSHPEELTRSIVRTLVAEGRLDLDDYAEWIGENAACTGCDVAESILDAQAIAEPALRIYKSEASTKTIERGALAAKVSLKVAGVSIVQAYLAAQLQADSKPHVNKHFEAWVSAGVAAIAACRLGRDSGIRQEAILSLEW